MKNHLKNNNNYNRLTVNLMCLRDKSVALLAHYNQTRKDKLMFD
jgi:hypothetical protein